MLKQIKKLNNQAFTIIEVMIVLAIAGMIILVVLLAVPAVQRNGRNTAIKNDASAVAGGITESESNNDGTPPTNVAGSNGTVTVTNTTNTTLRTQGSTTVTYSGPTGSAPASTAPALGTITVLAGHKCTLAGTYTPGTTGDVSARSFAVYYSIENAGGTVQKCLET